MEHPLNNISFIFIIWIFGFSPSAAHYCVWGLCESWEFCCAENVCCPSPAAYGPYKYNIWITVLIIVSLVIGTVLAGTCLYYSLRCIYAYLQQRYHGINFTSMPSEFESEARSIVYE